MAALPTGTKAPDFSLPALDGGQFSLQDALRAGPVLVAFFKVSCPTCQYAFPYLERIHRAHRDGNISMVGISQNNRADTTAFLKQYEVTFRVLVDDPNGYAVSNAYGLTNVPTLFLIAPDSRIEISSVGWVKQEVEDINRRFAAARQIAPVAIFQPGENVHELRAG